MRKSVFGFTTITIIAFSNVHYQFLTIRLPCPNFSNILGVQKISLSRKINAGGITSSDQTDLAIACLSEDFGKRIVCTANNLG